MALMKRTPLALLTASLLFGTAALGQESTRQLLKPNTTPTVIPVWNVHSGQIEGLLILEDDPQKKNRAWVRSPRTGNPLGALGSVEGINFDNGMAIFCSGQTNSFSQLTLLDSCQLGKKSARYPAINSPGLETKAMLQRKNSSKELGLPGLSGGPRQFMTTEFDAPVSGKSLNLSPAKTSQGWVSINGELTRAKLIPASQFPNGVPTEWDRNTFDIPERKKSLSGEVVGNVVQIPGQDNLQSIGAGVSWKTPWKGKVSVGAEGLLSQGRNSLNMDNTASAPVTDQRIDGVRPYVRVEIDL